MKTINFERWRLKITCAGHEDLIRYTRDRSLALALLETARTEFITHAKLRSDLIKNEGYEPVRESNVVTEFDATYRVDVWVTPKVANVLMSSVTAVFSIEYYPVNYMELEVGDSIGLHLSEWARARANDDG